MTMQRSKDIVIRWTMRCRQHIWYLDVEETALRIECRCDSFDEGKRVCDMFQHLVQRNQLKIPERPSRRKGFANNLE